jgi:hypothetical protein
MTEHRFSRPLAVTTAALARAAAGLILVAVSGFGATDRARIRAAR